MKRRIKRVFGVFVLFSILLIVFSGGVFALGTKLLCLTKGQIVKLSDCNSKMDDYRCTADQGCYFCVNENLEGIYCPANFNDCNYYGNRECTYLGGGGGGEDPSPTPEKVLPEINLTFPDNGYHYEFGNESNENQTEIEFQYAVTNTYDIDNCNLILNNENVASNNRATGNKIKYTVEEGYYLWKIQCAIKNSLTIVGSEERELFIGNAEKPKPSPTTQPKTGGGGSSGGGGGGGGGPSINDNNSSNAANQSNLVNTTPLSDTDVAQVHLEVTEKNESLETENPGLLRATGAVIGTILKPVKKPVTIVVVFVVVLGFCLYYFYYKRKIKKENYLNF